LRSALALKVSGGGHGTSARSCAGCAVEVEELAVESDTVLLAGTELLPVLSV